MQIRCVDGGGQDLSWWWELLPLEKVSTPLSASANVCSADQQTVLKPYTVPYWCSVPELVVGAASVGDNFDAVERELDV